MRSYGDGSSCSITVVLLGIHFPSALVAENLFLWKQLTLFQERKITQHEHVFELERQHRLFGCTPVPNLGFNHEVEA
jgi:hypothetical protein